MKSTAIASVFTDSTVFSDGRGLDWDYLQSKLNKHFDWNGAVNGILGTYDERAIEMVL